MVNIYLTVDKPAAILFQYTDERNFYAIEINNPGPDKIRLVKKIDGVGNIIKGVADHIPLKAWYRFRIAYRYENI